MSSWYTAIGELRRRLRSGIRSAGSLEHIVDIWEHIIIR